MITELHWYQYTASSIGFTGALIELVKLNEFGAPQSSRIPDKEDERVAALARKAQAGDYDEELVNEQLTRTASFLGPERFQRLRDAFVIVVGLGGVGSHCTNALARSGVSKLRLVDFDQVTLSSLNRHAVATLADVGTPKVDCVRRRLQAVVPWLEWQCYNEVWKEGRADKLLAAWNPTNPHKPDYVVDAIDNIDSKVALLRYCHSHDIKVVSSMGAGCKSDPSRIFLGDISASIEDPLSRVTRRRLRIAGIKEGIPVVYSTEKPGLGKAELLPLPDEEYQRGKVHELSVLPDFRARILPVMGTMPAIFGFTVANFLAMEITGYPHEASAGKAREKMYDAILSTLQGLEERMVRESGQDPVGIRIPVTANDVGYLIEEVYRGKSVISGLATRLTLVRWTRPEQGFMLVNQFQGQKNVQLDLKELVCMTKEEAAVHEREVLKGAQQPKEMYGDRIAALVDSRREEERQYDKYR
ncbi:MAG: hypothetical protein OHK93_003417 [Ramalina farinacea]|uniref:THIF-type NAD/FAD binding fold domain-containing protein n=1 Tax=Ramalina farinacea TaxID=258253 RepID=A0AA43QTC5_9LECA|nr:hypothetical protein [Ramalina farinacea]